MLRWKSFIVFVACLAHALSETQYYVTLDVDADEITLQVTSSKSLLINRLLDQQTNLFSVPCTNLLKIPSTSTFSSIPQFKFRALKDSIARGVNVYIVADKTENDDKDSYVSKLGDAGAKVVFWYFTKCWITHSKGFKISSSSPC